MRERVTKDKFVIPHGWKIQRIGDDDFAFITSGGTPSRANTAFYEGAIPWVKSGELKDCDIFDTEEHISEEAIAKSSAKIFPNNTVLLAMYGATVGRTAILKLPAATNQAVCAIQSKNESFLPQFLRYQLMQIRPHLLRERYGGAQPNISQTIIKALELPIPPFPEQKSIAAVLSTHWKAMEVQASIVETLRELKKSMMNRLFTQGLRGEPLKKTEIGIMPKSWRVATVEEIIDLCQYGTSERCTEQGLLPVLRINNLLGGRIDVSDLKFNDFENEDFAKYKMCHGDLLFNRTNSIDLVGKTAIFDLEFECAFSSYLIRLRVNDDNDPFYVNYYLNWDTTQKRVKGLAGRAVGQANISGTRIKSFVIPLPPQDEQSRIASILKTIDTKLAIHVAKKSALEDLFKTMLNELMTGALRVKDLDIDTSEMEVGK